jgi:hypothetical protein
VDLQVVGIENVLVEVVDYLLDNVVVTGTVGLTMVVVVVADDVEYEEN